jgi:cobalt-precorrin 5A hydrolase
LQQCPGATLAQVREVATIDLKAEEPGLLAFCATHGLPLRVIAREQIAQRACGQALGVGAAEHRRGRRMRTGGAHRQPAWPPAAGQTALDGVTVAIVDDGEGWRSFIENLRGPA